MKKSILFSLLMVFASLTFLSAQQAKMAAPHQFAKTQLLAFKDVNSLLAAINPGQDYSKYIFHGYNMTVTAAITNPDGSVTSVSASLMEPCGSWSKKQLDMIEKYAVAGAVFTLDGITAVQSQEPGTPYVPQTPFSMPSVSFSIK